MSKKTNIQVQEFNVPERIQFNFQTHYKNHSNQKEKESTQPSLTVPNQSMTIREIYQRYASGRSLSGVANPVYDYDGNSKYEIDFDDYMPDISKMDLADRQEIMESAKEQLDEVKKRLNAVAAARKREASDKEAELLKKIKKLEENQATQSGQSTQKKDTDES